MTKENEKNILQFPEKLVELAKNHRQNRLAQKKQQKEKRILKEKEKELIESNRLKNGLKYAEKIFEWAEAFRKSEVGQELMRISHRPTAYSNIFFFDGYINEIAWVGFVIDPKGLFLSYGGRFSAFTRKRINSASDLAITVDTRILETAYQWIEDGRAWECIERRFDYLKPKKTE